MQFLFEIQYNLTPIVGVSKKKLRNSLRNIFLQIIHFKFFYRLKTVNFAKKKLALNAGFLFIKQTFN